ncbi:MAG: hypothetical protein IKW39_02990 [Alphaproteobacteria bacterium]|nr:hypothetical protein [Alphaproteobacteria bacterium]
MIINTLAYLVIISIVGFFRVRIRWEKVIAWAMFCFSFYLFYDYIEQIVTNTAQGFSFIWNESKFGNITIDFNPSITTNYLLVPLFFISLLTLFNNNVFRYEERQGLFNSLILLNFVLLSLLICAKNYVQLITATFISDIVGYVLLKDVDSSRRYVIYNFIADMFLFMVFSLVSGRIGNIEISQLMTYEQIGRHQDFVSIVTSLALFIKLGAFSFQGYLLDISSARFQRMSMINILFCPLSGILLLLKLHNLLTISDLFMPLFRIMSILTFVTGLVLFVIKDNIRKKTVYFNMSGIGALMIMLYENSFSWRNMFSYYYFILYLYNIMFFKLYLYQNRQDKISEMINAKEMNRDVMLSILLLIALLVNLFISIMYKISIDMATNIPFYLSVVTSLSVAIVLNHIYKSPKTRRLDYLNKNSLRVMSFICNAFILILSTYHFKTYNLANLGIIALFLTIVYLPVMGFLRKFYSNTFLQGNQLTNQIYYHLIIIPLTYISRLLWLMADTLFAEKLIENTVSKLNSAGVSLFFKFNKKQYSNMIIFIFLGIIVFVVSFYRRELP